MCRGLWAPCGLLAFPRCAGTLSSSLSKLSRPRSAVVSQAERGNTGLVPSEAGQRLYERDFPRPVAKIARERYISGSRFPGREVVVTLWCPCEVTGGSRCDKDLACPRPAAPCKGPRGKTHWRNTPREDNNHPRRAGTWSIYGRGELAGTPLTSEEPAASTTPAASPRPGIFSGDGTGSKPPRWGCRRRGQLLLPVAPCAEAEDWLRGPFLTDGTCRPRADNHRFASAAGTGQPSHCHAFSGRSCVAWKKALVNYTCSRSELVTVFIPLYFSTCIIIPQITCAAGRRLVS